MKAILEHIDNLLVESPESLGIPKPAASVFDKKIPYRKNAHYAASFWLQEEHTLGMMYSDKIEDLMPVSAKRRFLKKMGVRRFARGEHEPRDINYAFAELIRATHTNREMITIRKKMLKVIKDRKVKQKVARAMDDSLRHSATGFFETSKHKFLITLLKNDKDAYKHFEPRDFESAKKTAIEIASERQLDKQRIIIDFPDGYVWYKLNEEECSIEGDLMQHCGAVSASGNDMYSLRDSDNKPHVTLEHDPKRNIVKQVRGKQNDAPKRKYWPYIKRFVDKFDPRIETHWRGTSNDEFIEFVTQDAGSGPEMTKEKIEMYRREFVPEVMEIINEKLDNSQLERIEVSGDIDITKDRVSSSLNAYIGFEDLPQMHELEEVPFESRDEILATLLQYIESRTHLSEFDALAEIRVEEIYPMWASDELNINRMWFVPSFDDVTAPNIEDYGYQIMEFFSPENMSKHIEAFRSMLTEMIEEENAANT